MTRFAPIISQINQKSSLSAILEVSKLRDSAIHQRLLAGVRLKADSLRLASQIVDGLKGLGS